MRHFLMNPPRPLVRKWHALYPVLTVGLVLFGANRAEAQYGYGSVYGGYGYGAGMGMTLEDQQLLKAQIYALNATQVQLNEARAQRDYWAAVLLSEQTRSAALANRKLADAHRCPTANKPSAGRTVTRRRHTSDPGWPARRNTPAAARIPTLASRDERGPGLRQP
jgi:hypothetical protein